LFSLPRSISFVKVVKSCLYGISSKIVQKLSIVE